MSPASAKPFQPQLAGVATAATRAGGVGIVAGVGQSVIDAQFGAAADDLGLGPADQGRMDGEVQRPSTPALVARLASRSKAAMYSGRQSG